MCICHQDGLIGRHFRACCAHSYKKYINEDGSIDIKRYEALNKVDPARIINELKKYIENSQQCAEAADELMQKAAAEENYMKATEMKVSKALHEMYAFRLQRIVDGKPAFEESKKMVNVQG